MPDADPNPAPAAGLRVSIIMLTYNQQDFVADAIRAALAQQCEPVEILISDDCSPDGTWEVIQQVVKGYAGPHTVRLNRNPRNQGVNAHLWSCVQRTSGGIIVAAAGDDISEPDRVRRIIAEFDRSAPLLVHSQVTPIRADASTAALPYEKALFFRTTDVMAAAGSMQLYVGATAAWHRDIFARYGPIPERDCYEDLVLGFRAALEGRVAFIAEPVVRYRVGVGISAAVDRFPTTDAWTAHRLGGLRRNLVVLQQRIHDATTFGLAPDHPVMRALHHHVLRQTLRADVHGMSLLPFLQKHSRHLPSALSAWQSERKRRRKAARRLMATGG
jgi:glycosyltransferase involved in cell wall biosynthesis